MLHVNSSSELSKLLKDKTVVIDTSSLLITGVNLLQELPKCDIVIPSIVVKELEDKRTHATLGFLAREWLRLLEKLRTVNGRNLSVGVHVSLNDEITLRVEPNHSSQRSLPKHLQDGSNDSTILAVAKNLADEGEASVVILSNDTPMRLHATLDINIEAVEFNSTIAAGAQPFDGRVDIHLEDEDYLNLDKVYKNYDQTLKSLVLDKLPKSMPKNAHIVVTHDGGTKPTATYHYSRGHLDGVSKKPRASGITARTLEQEVAMDYLYAPADELAVVSLIGGAGTGKTLLSIAVGLEELRRENYQKIIVFRSLHEMGQGQELGFLPGSLEEKMDAWAGAVYDALDVIAARNIRGKKTPEVLKTEVRRLKGMIEVHPITYLRGRSLSNSYIILDEVQNFSRSETLNILSRLGEGSKMILTGDSFQVDNRFLQSGHKADIWSVIESLKNEELFAHITLKRTERSEVAELAARLLSGIY